MSLWLWSGIVLNFLTSDVTIIWSAVTIIWSAVTVTRQAMRPSHVRLQMSCWKCSDLSRVYSFLHFPQCDTIPLSGVSRYILI